jgi:hypothetical protein
MPDYEADFPDMMEPAYILFDGKGGGKFAFGCVTGAINGASDGNAVEFTRGGNDEMDEACSDSWAELQPDGSIIGQISSTAAMKQISLRIAGRLLQRPARGG